MSEPLTFSEVAAIRERTQSLTLHAFLCRDIAAAGSLVNGAVDAARDILRLLDEVSTLRAEVGRLAAAPAVVVTQGVGFTEERLRRERLEERVAEAGEQACEEFVQELRAYAAAADESQGAAILRALEALRGDDVEERSNNPFDRSPNPADVAALRKAVRDAK